jgi:hypothetical protein
MPVRTHPQAENDFSPRDCDDKLTKTYCQNQPITTYQRHRFQPDIISYAVSIDRCHPHIRQPIKVANATAPSFAAVIQMLKPKINGT